MPGETHVYPCAGSIEGVCYVIRTIALYTQNVFNPWIPLDLQIRKGEKTKLVSGGARDLH